MKNILKKEDAFYLSERLVNYLIENGKLIGEKKTISSYMPLKD